MGAIVSVVLGRTEYGCTLSASFVRVHVHVRVRVPARALVRVPVRVPARVSVRVRVRARASVRASVTLTNFTSTLQFYEVRESFKSFESF